MKIEKKTIEEYLVIIVPLVFLWVIAALFILIYSFDMFDFVVRNDIFIIEENIFLLIVLMLVVTVCTLATLLYVGIHLDRHPEKVIQFTKVGIIGCSSSLFLNLLAMTLGFVPIIIISVIILFMFFGVLVVASNTMYGVMVASHNRAKVFSIVVFIFSIFAIIILNLTAIINAALGNDVVSDFTYYFPLGLITSFGVVTALIFSFYTRNWDEFGSNDKWPTRLKQILTRPSIQAYSFAHISLYFMLAFSLVNLSNYGATFNFGTGIELGSYKSFWATGIVGTGLFVIPSGIFADKYGRKTSIIVSCYIVVIASLIVGLFEQSEYFELSFTIAAFLLGISFALIFPVLDSSIWIDLAPEDSIARYSALNYVTLGIGLAVGYIFAFANPFNFSFYANVFLLLALSIVTVLPLFWISDSYPPLELQLLLVITRAGIPVFHYRFGRENEEDYKVSLTLISGALTAVGSFMREALGERDGKLNLVNHGSYFILTETEKETGLTVAAFTNKNDSEVQNALKKFLEEFQERYGKELENWTGRLKTFEDARESAENIFGSIVSS